MMVEWKRRNGDLWELFLDGQRKGAVKCLRGRKGGSVFSARIGGRSVQPRPVIGEGTDDEGNFLCIVRAKHAVELELGVG